MIDRIREIGAVPDLQVVVGGGVFNRADGLAEEIGDEGLLLDAQSAAMHRGGFGFKLEDSEALLARLEERRDPVKLNAHCFWMMWQYQGFGRFAESIATCDRGMELADLIGSGTDAADLDHLVRARETLSGYVDALHEPYGGFTPFDALGALARRADERDLLAKFDRIEEVAEQDLADLCREFAQKEIALRAPLAWDEERCPTDLLREMGGDAVKALLSGLSDDD